MGYPPRTSTVAKALVDKRVTSCLHSLLINYYVQKQKTFKYNNGRYNDYSGA